MPDSSTTEPRQSMSARRLWLFRLVALSLPLLLLGAVEVGLRVAGTGYPTSFVVPLEGKPGYVCDNYKFAWRFFPKALARVPQPLVVSLEKPANTKRIIVFGGSAAMGDPEPAYGVCRVLETLLEGRFSGQDFEVVNCAVTAINSHVALQIARDVRQLNADAWVIYMGNNEVHGPFGAGTVFGGNNRPLWLNRSTLALQRTKVGQLAVAMRGAGSSDTPKDWGGMKMFLDQKIRYDDVALDTVYANFERNLSDMVRLCDGSKTDVVVSTVATNLRDFPPFISLHRDELTEGQLATFGKGLDAGNKLARDGDMDGAITHYMEAAKIDAHYAELEYRIGLALLASGKAKEATRYLTAARDHDALRFRADTRINEAIRRVAKTSGATLADAEQNLAAGCEYGITGDEVLHEHVHINFAGNYRLAKEFATRLIVAKQWKETGGAWLTEDECRTKLGLSPYHEMLVVQEMRGRLSAPPFSAQSNFAARDGKLSNKVATLSRMLTPELGRTTLTNYRALIATNPDDWRLRKQLAVLLDSIGDLDGAADQFREIVRVIPHHAESHFRLGALMNRTKSHGEAEVALRRALELRPDFARAANSLGICLSHLGRFDDSYASFAEAVRVRPQFAEAWLNWGLVLTNQGGKSAALEKYIAAAKADDNYLPAHQQLGRLYVEADDHASALPHYLAVARLRPNEPAALVNLGMLYVQLERKDDARVQFDRVLKLDPGNRIATEALGKL